MKVVRFLSLTARLLAMSLAWGILSLLAGVEWLLRLRGLALVAAGWGALCGAVWGAPLSRPTITATAKGPNQINLTWPAVAEPGYGYLVEVQSPGDPRYSSWTECRPVPLAAGFAGDPTGQHLYAPPTNGVATWVTEPQYLDPQDGSAAQFMAASLKPATLYKFRVRTYRWNTASEHGPYSNIAAALTLNYPIRYVSLTGNDANDGTTVALAWRSLAYGSASLQCGQVLLIAAGTYPESLAMAQECTPDRKAVAMAIPGQTVTVQPGPGADHAAWLSGTNVVLDGVRIVAATKDYEVLLGGVRNALLNCETANGWGVHLVQAGSALVYGNSLHDAGNPAVDGGQGGFVLAVEHSTDSVVWSNRLTRGSHDVSLCKASCIHNRWLNNVMDGGWGMGFEAIEQSTGNLLEGSVIFHVQALMTQYKPSIEISSARNTVRRNIVLGGGTAVEVSALYGGDSVQGVLIYNNTFVDVGSCQFQSQNDGGGLGNAAYSGVTWANNICRPLKGAVAMDLYRAVTDSAVVHNAFVGADGKQFVWGHTAPAALGGGEYPLTLNEAELKYAPPFGDNMTNPARFNSEAEGDFTLHPLSPLTDGGLALEDGQWPVPAGFGIRVGAL